jgi:hypothetical protein
MNNVSNKIVKMEIRVEPKLFRSIGDFTKETFLKKIDLFEKPQGESPIDTTNS